MFVPRSPKRKRKERKKNSNKRSMKLQRERERMYCLERYLLGRRKGKHVPDGT